MVTARCEYNPYQYNLIFQLSIWCRQLLKRNRSVCWAAPLILFIMGIWPWPAMFLKRLIWMRYGLYRQHCRLIKAAMQMASLLPASPIDFSMLERAIAQNSSFVVSDIEAKRSSPSYSIDTINILIKKIGEQADLFFIIGLDAFLEIDTWKRYKDLPSLINFVVISRPTYSPAKVGGVICKYFVGYTYDPLYETWSSPDSKGSFILQHMEPVDISSTDIRGRVRGGKDITVLVSPAVGEYIKKQGLYVK